MKVLVDLSMIIKANASILKEYTEKSLLHATERNIQSILFDMQIRPTQVLLCADSRINFRKEVYDRYKESRSRSATYDACVAFVKHEINYELQEIEGLEADDVIYLNTDADTIIVSNDHDLKQCGAKMFSPNKKVYLDSTFTNYDFYDTILRGCKGDNVPALVARLGKSHLEGLELTFDRNDIVKSTVDFYEWINTKRTPIPYTGILRNTELTIFSKETYKKYGVFPNLVNQ